MTPTTGPWVLGHRGASAHAPENTLAAFELAFREGADGIELDVTLSADGVPVVIHDDFLDRTTGGFGRVWEHGISELKSLDAGSWFGPAFRGEKIPTLAEALDLARGRGIVNVEIKSGRGAPAGLAKAVMRTLSTMAEPEWIVVSSFDPRIVRRVRMARGWTTAFLRSWRQRRLPWRALALLAGADRLHVDAPLVDAAANWIGGYERVMVWTVDSPPEMERLAAAGVRGIITNRPAEALRVLGRKGRAA